jgi:hypothetical protein
MADGRAGYWVLLAVLAVWRVAHLLHLEHGPWGLAEKGRGLARRLGLGGLVDCFFCLSLWTALPAAWWLGATWAERIVAWLGGSAGAILIEVALLRDPPGRDG